MANLNKVILAGNITQDIELRYTPNGAAVVSNSLAINRTRMVNEEKVEETTFVDFTVWNNQAENLSKWQQKGSNILIEGHLQLDTWDDKDTGKKRSRLQVIADVIQYLGGKPQSIEEQAHNMVQKPSQQAVAQPTPPVMLLENNGVNPDGCEDDIPF